MLVAVEGIDGSGKATLSRALVQAWSGLGRPARVVSFPRYGLSPLADAAASVLASEELLSQCGPRATALLFAAERAASRHLLAAREDELVVIDRYVASNAAYQSARASNGDAARADLEWVFDLEFRQLGLPVPDLTVFVDVSVQESADRLRVRSVSADLGARPPSDVFEEDSELLRRARAQYELCALEQLGGRWLVVDGRAPSEFLVARVLDALAASGASEFSMGSTPGA